MLERFEFLDRDLEEDLSNCAWFLEKVRTRKDYAQNVYAALCNMRWQPAEVIPILTDEYWSCSWRSAGGIVADFRNGVEGNVEDYMDWYCSGISGGFGLAGGYDDETEHDAQAEFISRKYVPEGTVTDEVREDFATLGWAPSPWPKD
jgi:hypothetical protein